MTDPLRRLAPVVRFAPAKVNLTLAVVGRRPDGYHALHSVMVPLGWGDRLSVSALPSGADTLHVSGRDPGPAADNLVLRAFAAAREAVSRSRPWAPAADVAPPLAARLDKRIPVAGGLAGGSSDAAAALDAALEAWGGELDPDERRRLAARLGSDVPFFLAGGPALVEGRGEAVTALRGIVGSPPGILLVTPNLPVRTPDVFAAFAAGGPAGASAAGSTRLTSEHLAAELRTGLRAADLVARAGAAAAANDLASAAAVVAPGLLPFRRRVTRLLGRPVGLSGSGPTLWALYPSEDEAAEAGTAVVGALEAGVFEAPGDGRPLVLATTIESGASHGADASPAPGGADASPASPGADETRRTG